MRGHQQSSTWDLRFPFQVFELALADMVKAMSELAAAIERSERVHPG